MILINQLKRIDENNIDMFSHEKSQIIEEFFFSFFSEFVRKNSLALNYEFFWIMLFQIEFVISNSEIRYNDIFSDLL